MTRGIIISELHRREKKHHIAGSYIKTAFTTCDKYYTSVSRILLLIVYLNYNLSVKSLIAGNISI